MLAMVLAILNYILCAVEQDKIISALGSQCGIKDTNMECRKAPLILDINCLLYILMYTELSPRSM